MQASTPESFQSFVVPGKPLPFEMSEDIRKQLEEIGRDVRETVGASSVVDIIKR